MKATYINFSELSKNKHIYVEHTGVPHTNPPYYRDCYMIAYLAHGSGFHEIANNKISITEGDIFIIPPDTIHRFIPIKGLRRLDLYVCYFLPDIIQTSWNNLKESFTEYSDFFNTVNTPYIYAIDTENNQIRDILIRMIDEYMNHPPCYFDSVKGYLTILLPMIFRNAKTKHFERVYSQNNTVDESIRYIHRMLYSGISLADISNQLGFSPSYICRLFKKHLKMTTSEFINLLRIEKIKDILKNTNKPVERIPEMFHCNTDYIKRLFKKHTGMSMMDYRKKYHYKYGESKE